MEKMKIDILPNLYLKEGGTFDKESALNLCGKIAGVCYDEEGFNHIVNETKEKTDRRIDLTLNNGHHSVYDHITISFNLQNVPKILAMVLNNEHQYTTSEKSARFTPVVRGEDSIISETEEVLYNKWLEIYKTKIKEQYGDVYKDGKIRKLAQENARYLVTVFMPTQMIYSTSLRQINYIASWFKEYIDNHDENNDFEHKLARSMYVFNKELERLNVLEKGLMKNEKSRSISLFGENLEKQEEIFDYVYNTTYKGTWAQLAQAHRHRTLDYQVEMLENREYFVPEIIRDDEELVKEWLKDMESVKECYPQGELILINECGKYEDFILKCKERLCSAAQLEIMKQTKDILNKYGKSLKEKNHPLADDIKNYVRGARCTFGNFKCREICRFEEGITLTRRI